MPRRPTPRHAGGFLRLFGRLDGQRDKSIALRLVCGTGPVQSRDRNHLAADSSPEREFSSSHTLMILKPGEIFSVRTKSIPNQPPHSWVHLAAFAFYSRGYRNYRVALRVA